MTQITKLGEIRQASQQKAGFPVDRREGLESFRRQFDALFLEEKTEEANSLVRQMFSRALYEEELIEVHGAFGKLGDVSGLREVVDRLIAMFPERTEWKIERAQLLLDNDEEGRFEELLRDELRERGDQIALVERLCEFYLERDRTEDALQLARTGYEQNPNRAFAGLLDRIEKRLSGTPGSRERSPELPAHIGEQTVLDMLNLFRGRENVYARQWQDHSGRAGYIPVREPLSHKALENHLKGNQTVGVYQLDTDDCVCFIALDIDARKEAVEQFEGLEGYRELVFSGMRGILEQIRNILRPLRIPVYFEESGAKGYHAWIFLSEKMPARLGMDFGKLLREQVKVEKMPVSIEVFPKQSRVAEEGLGNLIKLPYGIHLHTGKRGVFLDDSYERVEDPSVLGSVQRVSPDAIEAALKLWHEQKPAPAAIGTGQPEVISEPVTATLDLSAHEEFQWLQTKCAAIRAITTRLDQGHRLSDPERLVLTHTLGHLEDGVRIVNHFLRLGESSPEAFLKSRLKGNPASCRKVRERVKHLVPSQNCSCRFESTLNTYPNPLLHLQSLHSAPAKGVRIEERKLRRMVEDFLRMNQEHRELTVRLETLRKELFGYMEEAGIDQVQTSFGLLILKDKDGSFELKL